MASTKCPDIFYHVLDALCYKCLYYSPLLAGFAIVRNRPWKELGILQSCMDTEYKRPGKDKKLMTARL